jgi:hypothetical protein
MSRLSNHPEIAREVLEILGTASALADVADAETDHGEANVAALNALGAKINEVLTVLRGGDAAE